MGQPTIEEALRKVEDRAALLRYLLDAASLDTGEMPDRHALSGLADLIASMGDTVRGVRMALDARALGGEVGD